jgi:heptosyltransferase-2
MRRILKSKVKKILIIRLSSIGDIVLTSPVIRLLRESYPHAQIDFLVRKEYAELVKFDKNLSYVYQYDVKSGWKGLREMKAFLSKQGFDVIIDLHRNFRSAYLRNISPGPSILKYNKNRILKFLLVKFKINLYSKYVGKALSVTRKYLAASKILGIPQNDLGLKLHIPKVTRTKSEHLWSALEGENFRVIVAPGARHFTKCWPAAYYAELTKKIYTRYNWRCIMLGSLDEIPLLREIRDLAGGEATDLAAGNITLLEAAGIIEKAPIFVSNDSGLMHIAAAFRKPQIAIFGSTTQELGFFPLNKKAIVIENETLPCRPCSHLGRDSCPKGHFKCMVDIKPEDVFKVFQSMVEKYKILQHSVID